MKRKFILSVIMSLLFVTTLASCDKPNNEPVHVDYTSELKLDMNNISRIREEVTVYNFVDGDTTHFNCKGVEGGVLKGRYLAIDTPESTMKIEKWGKTASLFTRSKLENAQSIIIESDTTEWTHDSSGVRYLVWVWYRNSETEDYRLLNLEIVQEGFSMVKNAESYEYGKIISQAYNQAINEKLHLFDKDAVDENYYTGNIQEITLRELRNNLYTYNGVKIRFDCLISKISGQTAYCQSYDAETDKTYGFPIYFGYTNYTVLQAGNMMSICGTLEYYETGDSWQVSDLTYIATKPDYSKNMKVISTGNIVEPVIITKDDLVNSNIHVENEDASKSTNTNSLLGCYVQMDNLTVMETYTTNNGGDNDGAITMTCVNELGQFVTVRTAVLKDSNKKIITEDYFIDENISVAGIVDSYNGEVQIKVLSIDAVKFN